MLRALLPAGADVNHTCNSSAPHPEATHYVCEEGAALQGQPRRSIMVALGPVLGTEA